MLIICSTANDYFSFYDFRVYGQTGGGKEGRKTKVYPQIFFSQGKQNVTRNAAAVRL
jgi:hypothetical protein